MSRVTVEPPETPEDHWEYNQYLCGDDPIQQYPRGTVSHIAERRFTKRR